MQLAKVNVSGIYLKCPKHSRLLSVNNNATLNVNGRKEEVSLAYCHRCNKYYCHSEILEARKTFTYKNMFVEVTKNPIVSLNRNRVKEFYDKVITVPSRVYRCRENQSSIKNCPLDGSKNLEESILKIIFPGNESREMKGFYCDKCGMSFVLKNDASNKLNGKMDLIHKVPVNSNANSTKGSESIIHKNIQTEEKEKDKSQDEVTVDKKIKNAYDNLMNQNTVIKKTLNISYEHTCIEERTISEACPFDGTIRTHYDVITINFDDNSKVDIDGLFCKKCDCAFIEADSIDVTKWSIDQILKINTAQKNIRKQRKDLLNRFEDNTKSIEIDNSEEKKGKLKTVNDDLALEKGADTLQAKEDEWTLQIAFPSQIRILKNLTGGKICDLDKSELNHSKNISIIVLGEKIPTQGYHCPQCRNVYISKNKFNDIFESHKNEFLVSSLEDNQDEQVVETVSIIRRNMGLVQGEPKTEKSKVDNIDVHNKEKIEDKKELVVQVMKNYSLQEPIQSDQRKSTDSILEYVERFELIKEHYRDDYPFSFLHYVIIYRRFDELNHMINSFTEAELNIALHFEGPIGYEKITPLMCAKWNLHYIYAYDEKNGTHISERLNPYLEEVESVDLVMEYDSEVWNKQNVFDIFFAGNQPLLDVRYIERQELASLQVKNNRISIVMDEVGTGKTVSALYAVKDEINAANANKRKARILIVCPYNKREDWQNDMRRQIGRFAHIVDQGDMGEIYSNHLKKVHFHICEHNIFICGQIQGKMDKNGSHSALKQTMEQWSDKEPWDLVIIDEVHISFNNFTNIKAHKAMFLTATPIVVTANECRRFYSYIRLLTNITGGSRSNFIIDPIHQSVPTIDDIYVNWFREDMGKKAAVRKIKFYPCKRNTERNRIFDEIKYTVGSLAALQYDQDDNYLFEVARNKYKIKNVPHVTDNDKIKKLVRILKENIKSYIIFCEHTFVVDLIYSTLVNEFQGDIVACKKGKLEDSIGTGNVDSGQLMNTLMQSLRQGRRVLFVTTGKSGGTGLNLGEFDGVIHYELPFTSIELEQRFGRVDRIDTINGTNEKDMVFLVNECPKGQSDTEVNRMLYYCTTKIDITCKYMPVRNTVLFYPEFIKRDGEELIKSMVYYQSEPILSEEHEIKIKSTIRDLKRLESEIKKMDGWGYLHSEQESFNQTCDKALKQEKNEDVEEECYKQILKYVKNRDDSKDSRNEYRRYYEKFKYAEKRVNQWLSIIGIIGVEDESIFSGEEARDDSAELEYKMDEEQSYDAEVAATEEEIASNANQTVQQRIKILIERLESISLDEKRLLGFSADGLYCLIDNKIVRSSVEEYRNGHGWR